ncbi:hypothetical protein V2J09_013499 [Rumex salicifolius]
MEVGCVYKLDHSKLSKHILGQLAHVRTVMVNEKTKNRVSVSYPSRLSLEMFFGRDENGGRRKSTGLMEPNLDAVYDMNLNLAETVLCNRVSFEEFAARRGTRSFWMYDSPSEEVEGVNGGIGVVKWGLRKRATFARKHRENNETPVLLEVEDLKVEYEKLAEEEGEERTSGRKRKHPGKYVKKKNNKKRGPVEIGMIIKKSDDFDNPTVETNLRWTKERYKKAEKSILKVMKAKEAFHGNPIFRADLRAEARNMIGDTGLLDHLLKHMAGKIAPGGKERFRRRHNPNGAMEYWLESADLVGIRMEAGVEDPYWIPPEGWKLGDSPTQDPVCARELKSLRGDVDKIKSEIQDLAHKKLDHEKSCLNDVPTSLDDVEKRRRFLLLPWKAMEEDLLKRKAKIEEKLFEIAKEMTDIEEDLGGLVLKAKGKNRAETLINEDAGEICSVEERDKAEKKAARRQRLKSGFRICKPDGSFLWPADVAESPPSFSAHLMIQVDDFLAVSSPSSVCSSKSPFPPPPPPPPQSAVLRPVAKKPSLGVAVSTVTRNWSGFSEVAKDKMGFGIGFGVASPTASSANSVFVPDLNESPLLDGHTTNLDSHIVQNPGFSSSIQSNFPFPYPSGGIFTLRAPISRMKNFEASDANDQLLLLPSPATPLLNNQVIMYQNKPNEQTAIDTPQSRCLSTRLSMSPGEQIEEGSFYEINRSKLPPRTPSLLLQSVRVVMVTVKSDQNLTVRYPSTKSLEAYFMDPSQNLYPEMDEKYIMGSQLAAEVLIRRVSSREFTRNSSLKAFWFVQTSITEAPPLPLAVCDPGYDVKSKLGSCLSELQSSNIKSWGERRMVFYGKSAEKKSSYGRSSSRSTHTIVEKPETQEEGGETIEVVKSEEISLGSSPNDDGQQFSGLVHVDIKTEMDCEIATVTSRPRKRKRRSYLKSKNTRTTDLASVKKGVKSRATQKSDQDNFRWSAQRYEHAKQELFSVMKARGAVYLNPISRYTLRAEARKQVGDTGLLDHLLKHVVDTLAPGGTERFKRRWDSKGVMEYWLESADLDDVRKKAGVQDPHWTPPPGWNPGDPICNHTSDCYSLITALKEELAQIRGEMQVMAVQKGDQALENISVFSNLGAIGSLNPAMFKVKYNAMLKEKARREQELLEISKLLKKMELMMKKQSGGYFVGFDSTIEYCRSKSKATASFLMSSLVCAALKAILSLKDQNGTNMYYHQLIFSMGN